MDQNITEERLKIPRNSDPRNCSSEPNYSLPRPKVPQDPCLVSVFDQMSIGNPPDGNSGDIVLQLAILFAGSPNKRLQTKSEDSWEVMTKTTYLHQSDIPRWKWSNTGT